MSEQIDQLLNDQSKRKRLQKLLTWSLGIMFVCSSGIFIFYEPQFLWFVSMIGVTVFLFFLAVEGMQFDPNEPDGGENKAKANGCFFFIALSISGLFTLSTLLSALSQTEHWELALGYGTILIACALIFPRVPEWTARRYPNIWRIEYQCGICELSSYHENQYHCPACDFVSTGKKRYGLQRHFRQAHSDIQKKLNPFKKVCEKCADRDKPSTRRSSERR